MDDSNIQICRLCLEVTPLCESQPIETIKKGILDVLLINIDSDLSDYAIACNKCLNTLQDCFDFKSHCINTFMDVDFKLDIKKGVLQNDSHSYRSICQKHSQVCSFCMSSIEIEALNCTTGWKDGVPLKDMLRSCFPKTDLHADHEPLICEPCLSSMKKYYNFMKSCQEVQERIQHFRQLSTHEGRIILEDMLKFNECNVPGKPQAIKEECLDADSVDDNLTGCLKTEETASIKSEEIDIKDELDKVVKTSNPHQSEVCDKDGLSKTEMRVQENTIKGKKHLCPKCPYAAKSPYHLRRHLRSHTDNEAYKCALCSFTTDAKFLLKVHKASHMGPSKVFSCRQCPYKTDHSTNFAQHILKHKDKSEVDMHKCHLCTFESKYRSKVVRHCKLIHKVNIKTYKCKECSYTTSCSDSLESHRLVHETHEEMTQYKCEKCEFKTKYKPSLGRHMLRHEDPEVANKFKCERCPYQAKAQSTLNRHMRTHPNKCL